MPELVGRRQRENPSRHRVHAHRHHQSNDGDDADGGVRHLPLILAPVGPQVHDGENEVGGKHDDIPHERR